MDIELSQQLLAWYAVNARRMPWRGSTDPYEIWISEVMLQQTRVETVIPYFVRWMETFPDIVSLSESDENQVLKHWEGLGYYSRARSILKTARIVCDRFGGKFPSAVKELLSLPGIGKYTAGAISSIAFGSKEAVLDGNVKRVLARVFAYGEPVNTPEGENHLWNIASSLVPDGNAGEYNQAVMDLGATICLPLNPKCDVCPISSLCESYKGNKQSTYPVLNEKMPIPHITVCAAIIMDQTKVLIARRPSKGLLGGMWEFPGGKQELGETLQDALVREIKEELGTEINVLDPFNIYKHAYTHFRVTLHAFLAEITGHPPRAIEASELKWVEISDLQNYPMGKIDRRISDHLLERVIQHNS
jgi:A/G-specific adenine glycosylase